MRINKLELQNSLTEWNYKTNLPKNLSIISVISRGYRFCNFLQQIGHFTDIIILRFHYREQQKRARADGIRWVLRSKVDFNFQTKKTWSHACALN